MFIIESQMFVFKLLAREARNRSMITGGHGLTSKLVWPLQKKHLDNF